MLYPSQQEVNTFTTPSSFINKLQILPTRLGTLENSHDRQLIFLLLCLVSETTSFDQSDYPSITICTATRDVCEWLLKHHLEASSDTPSWSSNNHFKVPKQLKDFHPYPSDSIPFRLYLTFHLKQGIFSISYYGRF